MEEYEVRTVNIFKVLSNPVRYKILKLLGEFNEITPGKLSKMLGRDFGRISSHLKIMKDAKLVRHRTERGRVYYKIKKLDILAVIERVEDMERR
jgi:DNA-binding transcriptional ArsR family regulator